jgi:hypothetical protein
MVEVMAKRHSLKALAVRLPTRRRTVAIVFLKDRTLSPIAQLFIETVRTVAKSQSKAKEIAR